MHSQFEEQIEGRVGAMVPLFTAGTDTLTPRYQLTVGAQDVVLSDFLGCGMTLTYREVFQCQHCHVEVHKLFGGGHCYDCFSTLAQCDLCVMSPDRCHFHLGTCREPQWGEDFCMQPHSVYLSNTSGPKIGITRFGRESRRWLDQGASEAVRIIAAPTRRAAGVVEAHFKRQLNDRTDWRKMVAGHRKHVDLVQLAWQLKRDLGEFVDGPSSLRETQILPADEIRGLTWLDAFELIKIDYPVLEFSPPKRLVLSAQAPIIRDNLRGIVGQYLLFSQGAINLQDYRGAAVEISLGEAFNASELDQSDQLSLF